MKEKGKKKPESIIRPDPTVQKQEYYQKKQDRASERFEQNEIRKQQELRRQKDKIEHKQAVGRSIEESLGIRKAQTLKHYLWEYRTLKESKDNLTIYQTLDETNPRVISLKKLLKEALNHKDRLSPPEAKKNQKRALPMLTTLKEKADHALFMQEAQHSLRELHTSFDGSSTAPAVQKNRQRVSRRPIPEKKENYHSVIQEALDFLKDSYQSETPLPEPLTTPVDDQAQVISTLNELGREGNSTPFSLPTVKNLLERLNRFHSVKMNKPLQSYVSSVKACVDQLTQESKESRTSVKQIEEKLTSLKELHHLLLYQVLAAFTLYYATMSHRTTFESLMHGDPGTKDAEDLLGKLASLDFRGTVACLADFLQEKQTMRDSSFVTFLLQVLLASNGFITLLDKSKDRHQHLVSEQIYTYRSEMLDVKSELKAKGASHINWVRPPEQYVLFLVKDLGQAPKECKSNAVYLANDGQARIFQSGKKPGHVQKIGRHNLPVCKSSGVTSTKTERPEDVQQVIQDTLAAVKYVVRSPAEPLGPALGGWGLLSKTTEIREARRQEVEQLFRTALS